MVLTENKKLVGFPVNHYKVDYNSWPLDWLANYIEKKQRRSLAEKSKAIRSNLSRMCSLHRNYNSDLLQMEMLFKESIKQLYTHMEKEEAGLFPFIRELILAKELNKGLNRHTLVKIEAFIVVLNEDHERESQRLKLFSQMKHNYTASGPYSKMHKALFTTFSDFQEDLELHIYLQSKFLFPKIISIKYDVT